MVSNLRTRNFCKMRGCNILAWALTVLFCTPVFEIAATASATEAGGHGGSSHCVNLTFTVQATAVNKVVPSPAASTLSTQDGVNAFYASLPAFWLITRTRPEAALMSWQQCTASLRDVRPVVILRNQTLRCKSFFTAAATRKNTGIVGPGATAIRNIRGREP